MRTHFEEDRLAMTSTNTTMTFRQEAALIAAIGAGTFVFSFQVAAVLVALPALGGFMHPAIPAGWIVTTYLLCLAALLLLFGRLGDVYGNRRLYLAGLGLFTAASLGCAVAGGPLLLLCARAAEGIGAALASANSPALLARHLPPERRGRALGFQATMTYLGLAIGPAVAAFLLPRFTWRGIFLIDVPVGILAIGLALYALPQDCLPRLRVPIRWSGPALWLACLVPLLFALSQGSQWGWSSRPVVTLFVVSPAVFSVLIFRERRSSFPFVDFALFRSAEFSLSVACEASFYLGIYATGFLIPILVIRSRGLGAATAGVLLTTQALVRMVFSPLAGMASDRFGTARMILSGGAVFAFGALLLWLLSQDGSLPMLGFAVALLGLGTSFFVPANSARLFASAPVANHGMAAGTLATARNLGMLLGTAGAAAACARSLHGNGAGAELAADLRTALGYVFAVAVLTWIANVIPVLRRWRQMRPEANLPASWHESFETSMRE
jgi:EmrB/QacA subfamily drug resistance transporter